MIKDEWIWTERYRPKKIADCILPERIKAIFQEYVNKKSIPNLLLSGTPGTGKTTAAMAMCEEIGLSFMYINSSKERGIDMLRTKIQNYASAMSLTGGHKVIILDEADYLTAEAMAGLRGAIEQFSKNCTFIFTCNQKSRLTDAIHSRTANIEFKLNATEKPEMAKQLFIRIKKILDQEGVAYEGAALAKIIEKHFPDFRKTLNELQRFSQLGAIDASVVAQLNDVRRVSELVGFLKEKNFAEMRKWVVANSDIEPSRVYRTLYDALYDYFTPASIPQAVLIIARYQYQAAFVADQEINQVACLTEIMVDTEVR